MERNHKSFITRLLMAGTIMASFLSCDSIYDDPAPAPAPVPTEEHTYQYINATDYTKWIYINLHEKDSVTLDYRNTEDIPAAWDIAIHRYDVKTNGGAALETSYTELAALESDVENGILACPQDDAFVRDVAAKITVDMSHMMEGYLEYADTDLNQEIGKWLNVDTSTMPPIYTPSNKVYLLRLSDGTVAALHFTGFANPNYYNTKGYISFDYLYPLNFKQ